MPGNTVPVGSVNRNLSVLFCCSACVVSRAAALAGCIGQKLVGEGEPLAGCSSLPCYKCGNCWVSFELQEIYMECSDGVSFFYKCQHGLVWS